MGVPVRDEPAKSVRLLWMGMDPPGKFVPVKHGDERVSAGMPFLCKPLLLNLLLRSPLQLNVPTKWRPPPHLLPAAHITMPNAAAPPALPRVVLYLLAFTQALESLETHHVPHCSPP